MYERMLDKKTIPAREELVSCCEASGELFCRFHDYVRETLNTTEEIRFPYGNKYGWCITHRKGKKLVCDVFAEKGSFTVMIRLLNTQFDSVYPEVSDYTRHYIDNKYPCNAGGWIHYRVTKEEHLTDIEKMISCLR